MYIYESHLGELYGSEYFLDDTDLYCETCEDYDENLGWADTPEDALIMLADNIDIPAGSGGWNFRYIMDVLRKIFPDCRAISNRRAHEIILQSRTQEAEDDE